MDVTIATHVFTTHSAFTITFAKKVFITSSDFV